MVWKGVVIEESLNDKGLLGLARIVGTSSSTLEAEEEKGSLHFHKVEVDDAKKSEFVDKAKRSIKNSWYIHICRGETMAVIFKDKSFEFTKAQKDKLEQTRSYGLSIGIIREQLPTEKLI
jgi:hypothetical protein